jgi:hypothetical protein
VYIRLDGQNLDQTGRVYVKVRDTAQVVTPRIDDETSVVFIIFEMPKAIELGDYTIQISTDGAWFLPPDDTW